MPKIRATKAHTSAVGSLEVGDEREVSEKDARSLVGAGVAELVAPKKPAKKKARRRKAKEKAS